jgi:hypothetical protein
MEAFSRDTDLAHPMTLVAKTSTAAGDVGWWPTYAVIDHWGNLRAIGLKPDYVERVVEAMLAE